MPPPKKSYLQRLAAIALIAMAGFAGSVLAATTNNVNFGSDPGDAVISQMIAAKHTGASGGAPTTGPALSTITLDGLTIGHTYRLQLISNIPRNAVVDVEGRTYRWLVGNTMTAELVSATWVAGDSELNVGWLGQAHDYYPTFNAYALHDLGAAVLTPTPTITGFTGPVAGQFTIRGTTDLIAGNLVTEKTTSLATPIHCKFLLVAHTREEATGSTNGLDLGSAGATMR